MLIAARNGFLAVGKSLPYDADVEYLESTETQWINTRTTLSSTDKVETRCRIISNVAFVRYVFGVFGEGKNFGFNLGSANVLNGIWGSIAKGSGNGSAGVDYDVELSSDGLYVNGALEHTVSGTFTGTKSAYLFWANGTSQKRMSIRIYNLKIYHGSTLVRDFIPVRFTNELGQSEGAMFDRANPTVGMNRDGTPRNDGLYLNRGTGAFVIGPDK